MKVALKINRVITSIAALVGVASFGLVIAIGILVIPAEAHDDPIAHWKFDETSGTTASDSSGSGRAVSLSGGPIWTAGRVGGALQFDGANDVGRTASAIQFGSKVATASFWLWWDAYANDNDIVMELSSDFSRNDGTFVIIPNSASPCNNGLQISIQDGVSGARFRTECFARPLENVWHHYAVIIDNSTTMGDVKLYVDGVEQPSASIPNNEKDQSSVIRTDTMFLMSRAGSSWFGKGKLDDVRIYNRALSLDEIQALHSGSVSPTEEEFPAPTNLIATPASCLSGGNVLSWNPPESNEVLGYRVYRNGVLIPKTGLFGRLTTSYQDTTVTAGQSYSYTVKAVYLEEDSSASNAATATAPSTCSEGITCPLKQAPERVIVSFSPYKKLFGDGSGSNESGPYSVSLASNRTYRLTLVSYDNHRESAEPAERSESYYLALRSDSGRVLASSEPIADLQSGQNYVIGIAGTLISTISDEKVKSVSPRHIGYKGKTTGANDLTPVCAAFDPSDRWPIPEAIGDCRYEITKSVNPGTVAPGGTATFRLDIKNNSSASSACSGGGSSFQDIIPSNITYVSDTYSGNLTSRGSYAGPFQDTTNNLLNWNIGTFMPGETGWIEWVGRLGQAGNACPVASTGSRARTSSREYNQFGAADGILWVQSNEAKVNCESPLGTPAPVVLPRTYDFPVTCTVNPSSAEVLVEEPVTVTALPQGGSPPYSSYRWTGDVDTRNPVNQQTHRAVYGTVGIKRLNVEVVDSEGQVGQCDTEVEVVVKVRPSFEEF